MKFTSLFFFIVFTMATFSGWAQEGASPSSGGVKSSVSSRGDSSGSDIGMVVGANYILKPSDVVQVDVYQESDLNKSVRVEGDGTVSLALIGKVKVSEMTVGEAQSLVTDLYNRDFLVDPQVSLLVVSFSPKKVRILGSVNRPGVVSIPPDSELMLTEAIASVNGISRLGNPKSVIIKRIGAGGQSSQMEVNFSQILTKRDARDVRLQEGDVIWVPERIF